MYKPGIFSSTLSGEGQWQRQGPSLVGTVPFIWSGSVTLSHRLEKLLTHGCSVDRRSGPGVLPGQLATHSSGKASHLLYHSFPRMLKNSGSRDGWGDCRYGRAYLTRPCEYQMGYREVLCETSTLCSQVGWMPGAGWPSRPALSFSYPTHAFRSFNPCPCKTDSSLKSHGLRCVRPSREQYRNRVNVPEKPNFVQGVRRKPQHDSF